MSYKSKNTERETEIVSFYYLIFGNRIHSGMEQDDARQEAYDAVSLRYGIGKGRLLNIISACKNYRQVKTLAFRHNAMALISDLEIASKQLDAQKRRTDKLISLLKECIDDR